MVRFTKMKDNGHKSHKRAAGFFVEISAYTLLRVGGIRLDTLHTVLGPWTDQLASLHYGAA